MERNVLGEELQPCSETPLTGFTRNGCCSDHQQDLGKHLVCVRVDVRFLAYSHKMGNDLSTPQLQFAFPGLQPGDSWCLCAARWQQAYEDGCAPPVLLAATHASALTICAADALYSHALDLN